MDRNTNGDETEGFYYRSLSARRAWIEILTGSRPKAESRVALRKESVDRNINRIRHDYVKTVALRKESVDRNTPTSRRPARS